MIPVTPPRSWFDDPQLAEPTALRVLPTGRVYGHFAMWGECHIGYPEQCVTPPHSEMNYGWFRTGEVECDDGSLVPVGQLTMDGPHADLYADAAAAAAHYDNTCVAVADVAAGEDDWGPWVAGALRPHCTAEMIRALRGADLSGDWRTTRTGRLELVAVLAVNSGGFKVPRVAIAASGEQRGAVSLGMVKRRERVESLVAAVLLPDLINRAGV